jgi:hypothetical protein
MVPGSLACIKGSVRSAADKASLAIKTWAAFAAGPVTYCVLCQLLDKKLILRTVDRGSWVFCASAGMLVALMKGGLKETSRLRVCGLD